MADEIRKAMTLEDLEDIKCLLEAGMQEEAEAKLVSLAKDISPSKEDEVFEQVGTLTRDLHNAIKSFADDERLKVIANVDIPRASERLSSIIRMTDSAASRTLDAVDACEPMLKSLQGSVEKLLPAWSALMHGRIDRDNFVTLCRNVDGLIHDTKNNAEKLCEQLNVILMAQDYQDLTGQMIQKVITLVGEVEDKLLNFLMKFSQDERDIMLKSENDEAVSGISPQGPALESVKEQSENIAASQDDVDDLLASLGF